MHDTSPHTFQQRLLVLFAHPALEKSRVNRRLAASVDGLPGVTFHDLYEAYSDFYILADREQKLLAAHDTIVFQFPFFWYSTPALLKEWQDIVLEHGWAYGSEGNALRGKTALFVVSTGGSEAAYQVDGYNRHTVRQFLAPLYQTLRLCGIDCLPPFVVHGTHAMPTRKIEEHAADYRRVLEAIRDGRIDVGDPAVVRLSRLNANLDEFLAEPSSPASGARGLSWVASCGPTASARRFSISTRKRSRSCARSGSRSFTAMPAAWTFYTPRERTGRGF